MSLGLVAAVLAGGLLVCLANTLALIPWRRSKNNHWTERARLLYPARVAASGNLYCIPATVALVLGPWISMDKRSWFGVAVAASLGVALGSYPFDRVIWPWLTFRDWSYEAGVSWLFRLGHWFLFIGLIAIMPPDLNGRTLLQGTLGMTVLVWFIWCGSMRIARWIGLLAPAPQRLRAIVKKEAAKAGTTLAGVWTLSSVSANALALPHTREVIFTTRALTIHPDDELAAIAAHEIGHLTESRWTVTVRVLGSMVYSPWLFASPLAHRYGIAGVLFLVCLTGLGLIIKRRFERRFEIRADRCAKGSEDQGPIYARALNRLHQDNQLPAVLPAKRHAHPDLFDRLVTAGVTPEYPRPKAPDEIAWPGIVFGASLGMLIVARLKDVLLP